MKLKVILKQLLTGKFQKLNLRLSILAVEEY